MVPKVAEITLPVDQWYEVLAALHEVAAEYDEYGLDQIADKIHDQLEKIENSKWRKLLGSDRIR